VPNYLTTDQVAAALALRDLTDPEQSAHAMQRLLSAVVDTLTTHWDIPARWTRTSPLVAVADNYDHLGFPPAAITRDARYSRYVSPTVMLRSHMTAAIPAVLRSYAAQQTSAEQASAEQASAEHRAIDDLQVLPGLVYRRDAIDRTHVGEPHQVDLWRLSSVARLGPADLVDMIAVLVGVVLPGARWRAVPASHPYTTDGRQIDVQVAGEWLELAECGLVPAALLEASGLPAGRWSGLALGMGLDRALMLRKGVDDIRVLRSTDARICAQLQDLEPWRPVSALPAIRRDLSIVIDADDDDETLGDRVRAALGPDVDDLESVIVLARTGYDQLPVPARERLGLAPTQLNALVRVVLRPLARTLTDAEANRLRDRVYTAIHRGPRLELIGGEAPVGSAG
jgi:phenylalanyl-tRNA synthetase alpha chain